MSHVRLPQLVMGIRLDYPGAAGTRTDRLG